MEYLENYEKNYTIASIDRYIRWKPLKLLEIINWNLRTGLAAARRPSRLPHPFSSYTIFTYDCACQKLLRKHPKKKGKENENDFAFNRET